MTKKDVSRVLSEGTPKQRIQILAEHIARGRFDFQRAELRDMPPLLTEAEATALHNSFKKPNEIRLYNQWRKYDNTVVLALNNLQGFMLQVKLNYANLRGYILVWNEIEGAELLANSLLHEIKDPQERRRIAESGTKGVKLLFANIVTDKEGYIEAEVDFEKETYQEDRGRAKGSKTKKVKSKWYSLWYAMNNVKEEATQSAIKFMSCRRAILDFMEETGFNVKLYKDMIRVITEEVLSPVIGWGKYLSDQDRFISSMPKGRLDKLKSLYSITPNPEDLGVDEEIYSWFRDNFLRDE